MLRNSDFSLILFDSGFQPWFTFDFCERIKKRKSPQCLYSKIPKESNQKVYETQPSVFPQTLRVIQYLVFPGATVCLGC